jgi:hypothetical protein
MAVVFALGLPVFSLPGLKPRRSRNDVLYYGQNTKERKWGSPDKLNQ